MTRASVAKIGWCLNLKLVRLATNSPEPENGSMYVNTLAKSIVEQSIGEKLDGTSLPVPTKSAVAIAHVKLGGAVGSPAGAEKLTPIQRRSIPVRAANVRWGVIPVRQKD